MHAEMRQLLNAYLDGELGGLRLVELQSHLASCEDCRNELKELRLVSELLQAAPDPACLPVDQFVSSLAFRLPRRTIKEGSPRTGSLLWWLVPLILIGAWYFLRTAFTLTAVVSAVDLTGLFEQVTTLVQSGNGQSAWLMLINQAASIEASTFSLLNTIDTLGADLVTSFLWQAAIALLYWFWLAGWWWKSHTRPMKLSNPLVSL